MLLFMADDVVTGFRLNDTRLSESEKEKYVNNAKRGGFKGYLTAPETAEIIRWAQSQLEVLHGIISRDEREHGTTGITQRAVLAGSISLYEGLILKLEGRKDNATQTENRG
jgi:hypothetical protein